MAKVPNKLNPINIPKLKFEFHTPLRESWIRYISECRKIIKPTEKNEIIELFFGSELELKNFYPINIVLLTCFIDEIKSKGYLVQLNIKNPELSDYLFKELNLTTYWGTEKLDHIESPTITDLNIWRITEKGKEFYSISVHDYFKRIFTGIDLSAIKVALNELYFNVFDHANAKGNAFSFIRYDKEEGKILVAICDFGEGIARTLRKKYVSFENDSIALENCIKVGISAQTQKYNKGFGLDNVASTLKKGDMMRIVSNQALLHILDDKSNIKIFDLDFDFNGTLIYFEVLIENFEEEEMLDDFSFIDE